MDKSPSNWLWVALVFAALWYVASKPQVSLNAGKPAPNIQARDWINSAVPMTLASLRGKVVVVEFWATWCGPCVESIPHLNQIQDQYSEEALVVVGLTDEPLDRVKPFVEKHGIRYAVGAGSASGYDFGVQGIPQSYVIDRHGNIVWSGHPRGGLQEAVALALEEPTTIE